MADERKRSPWIAWCSGIAALLGLYVGAYVAMVQPRRWSYYTWAPVVIENPQKLSGYLVDHPAVYWIFAPLERIDRRVRTDFWDHNEVSPAYGRM